MLAKSTDSNPSTNFKLFWEGVRSWPDWEVRTISVINPTNEEDNSVSASFTQKGTAKKVQQLQLYMYEDEDSWATMGSSSGYGSAFKCRTEFAHVMELQACILDSLREKGDRLQDISIKLENRPKEFQENGFYHIHITGKDRKLVATFKQFVPIDSSNELDAVHFFDLQSTTKKKLNQTMQELMRSRRVHYSQVEATTITLVTQELTKKWSQQFSLEQLKLLLVEADSRTVCMSSDYRLSCMFERPVVLNALNGAVELKNNS